MTQSTDAQFAGGSLPLLYNTHLVPLLFEPFAEDLARRLASRPLTRVLEIAAGTGVVTRQLATRLPQQAAIVASDLNQPMLDQAATIGTSRPVEWRQADAMDLPFENASFDAVVCQFGVMFFPDKARAFADARRVLKPGGTLLFNVWDRISENEFSDVTTIALQEVFPDDPPRFLPRTPYGYHDPDAIARDLAAGGFTSSPSIETVRARSRAASAQSAVIGLCQGTPLRGEIEARDASRLQEATDAAARAIAKRFGEGPVDGKMQALVVEVRAS